MIKIGTNATIEPVEIADGDDYQVVMEFGNPVLTVVNGEDEIARFNNWNYVVKYTEVPA